eukprot:1014230-Prorocentrum_minimum.AAC.3
MAATYPRFPPRLVAFVLLCLPHTSPILASCSNENNQIVTKTSVRPLLPAIMIGGVCTMAERLSSSYTEPAHCRLVCIVTYVQQCRRCRLVFNAPSGTLLLLAMIVARLIFPNKSFCQQRQFYAQTVTVCFDSLKSEG